MNQARICLVDDETDVLSALDLTLGASYRVSSFNSAENALEAFDQGLEVDLLISDLKMPKMDGLKLISTLREREFKSQIILSSGYADKDHLVHALKLGVSNFIQKPFRASEIRKAVADVILTHTAPPLQSVESSLEHLLQALKLTNKKQHERITFVERRLSEINPNGFDDPTQIESFLKLMQDNRIAERQLDLMTASFVENLEALRAHLLTTK